MQRFLIIWLSVLPLFLSAANTLTLSTVSGHPGETLTITASLTNSDAVTALQADIPLGANLRYVDGSAELMAARSNGHYLYAAAVKDTLHVTIFSLTGNTIVGIEGDLFTFRVTLSNEPATYPLSAALTLADVNSQGMPATVIAGSATILSPKIEVVTTAIDYGHIPIRATYTKTLQVRNTGNEPLHISNVLFSAAEFSVAATEYTIPAGQTQNITLTFTPLLHGAITETLRLRSDAVNDADIYGANIAVLTADPFSVNELRVQAASGISDDTVTVFLRMNNMETDLVGVQVSFKMPKQLEYIANSVAPSERATAMSATSVLSNDTLTLILYSIDNTAVSGEDGNLLTFDVRLNGTSGSYALKPINTMLINTANQNMVSAVYQANVTIQSPTISGNTSLALGHIPVNEKCTAVYSVRNTGQAPLTVEGATFLQEGFRLLTSMPLVIAKNANATIQIEFTPYTEGNVSTTMQLYSNDPVMRMKSVTLSASVYEPNAMTLSGRSVGTNYLLEIGMENYSDLTGVQFDLVGLVTFLNCEKSARASSHMLSWSEMEEGRYRFILFAMDNTPLGYSGELLRLTFDATQAALLNGNTVSMDNITVVHTASGAKEVTAPQPWLIEYVPGDEPTGIDGINYVPFENCHKLMRNGQVLILRGDKTYTLTGQEVK